MDTKRKVALEVGLNVLFIAIAIGMFIVSKEYKFVRGTLLGSRTFPILIGSIMSIFGIVNIIKALSVSKSPETTTQERVEEESSGNGFFDFIRKYRVAIAVGLMVVYYLMLWLLGFIIATALFLPAMLYLLEYRKPVKVAIITVLGVAFLYIAFKVLLGVPLPGAKLF
jgi:hypothetical protein